jgi:hypothetical protein
VHVVPVVRALVPLALLMLAVGCAEIDYRERATVSRTRYATIDNFSDRGIAAGQVDRLLEEVADILGVRLDPRVPRVRILVLPPARIADVYRRTAAVAPRGTDAVGLYFPGASVVMVAAYDRKVLGHELAHYLTDHYLPAVPRRDWEDVADHVETALSASPSPAGRRAPLRPPGDAVALGEQGR